MFGPKSDMFALGILLYILLCGLHPFDPYNNLTDEEIRTRFLIVDLVRDPDEDEKQDLESVKRSFAWGLSSSVEALNEKTSALLSSLHYFDKEGKGFISKSDLARVSESFGKHMSESKLN
ncbi:hypothetical protein PsorP6_008907 [Peronosclerospora sorghi]|uniref:Uncharacterized protein n=1 Tax=Peronosclerospora sorghi TaxID=230839 RepID=A0ACC0W004_9STRA|nr:hypothetical protein PsorP6_008907 [Peronosclerospora sorghi]